MSPARDFGPSDNHDDNQPDDHNDQEEDHDMTAPEPIDPDELPGPERAIEAPKHTGDRLDVDTPTVGQLYAMFPDALPKNTPERRKRHLAAVPDPSDVATLPAGAVEDNDPLIAAALRWRAVIAFWWRPATTTVAVFVIAVCAFTAAGPVVGVAWCLYGTGWIAHSIWHVHGRPSLHKLARNRRGSGR